VAVRAAGGDAVNRQAAQQILDACLEELRGLGYVALLARIGEISVITPIGEDGKEYQVEIEVLWDDLRQRRDLLVMASVDDGGWSAFAPLHGSFIVSPESPG